MKRISLSLLILFFCLTLFYCHKKSSTGPDAIVPVTLSFEVCNHTQGYLSSFTRNVMSNDVVMLKISELGVSDVEGSRIALFHDGFSQGIGFSSTGEISFQAPGQSTSYNVVLFNALGKDSTGEQVSYDWMDAEEACLYLDKNNYEVFRKDYDGVTGTEEPWEVVWDQINSAIKLGWVTWGTVENRPYPNGGEGDFSYGYAVCLWNGSRIDGFDQGYRIIIDPEVCVTEDLRISVGLEEAFQNITCTKQIGGKNPRFVIFDGWAQFGQNGKDLFTYVFVKMLALGNVSR